MASLIVDGSLEVQFCIHLDLHVSVCARVCVGWGRTAQDCRQPGAKGAPGWEEAEMCP